MRAALQSRYLLPTWISPFQTLISSMRQMQWCRKGDRDQKRTRYNNVNVTWQPVMVTSVHLDSLLSPWSTCMSMSTIVQWMRSMGTTLCEELLFVSVILWHTEYQFCCIFTRISTVLVCGYLCHKSHGWHHLSRSRRDAWYVITVYPKSVWFFIMLNPSSHSKVQKVVECTWSINQPYKC